MERDGTLQDASLDLTYPGDVAASLDGISIKFAENLSRKRNPDVGCHLGDI